MTPEALTRSSLERRDFLTLSLSALVVGVLPGCAPGPSITRATTTQDEVASEPLANAFVRVDRDDRLTVLVCQCELGQGTSTGLAMLAAEEFGAEWTKVGFELVTGRPEYFHPTIIYSKEQITAGSVSLVAFAEPIRRAAAAARELLLAVAATEWQVPRTELTLIDSRIVHAASGRAVGVGTFAARAARLEPPAEVTLKYGPPRLVGRPTRRLDAAAKVCGAPVFAIDVTLPGLVYAAVRQAPAHDQELARLDAARALLVPGVLAVERIPRGYAVVATSYWHARQALDQVDVQWTPSTKHATDTEAVFRALRAQFDSGTATIVTRAGSPDASALGQQQLAAEYGVPFLAHATMEPPNATADVRADRVDIWAGTQTPTLNVQEVSRVLGIAPERVTVHMCHAGGGFGRRGFSDDVVQAAALSRAVGRPVKVIWSREEDLANDYMRPAMLARLDGRIDADGTIETLSVAIAGPGVWKENRPPIVEHFKGVDPLAVEGANDLRYAIPNRSVKHYFTAPAAKIGYWRSIGYSHNVFFVESFCDELIERAGGDPYAVRRRMLAHDPRSQAVLDAVAKASNWGSPLDARRGRGIAFFAAERWQTRVAQVAEVTIAEGRVRVDRIVCAADVGLAVNPLSVETQLQGAITFALSAALYGQIDLAQGRVLQSNFAEYRLVTLADAPQIEIVLLQGGDAPGSVGEIGVPCTAPAVVNAVFAATGQRVRSLPLAHHTFG